VNYDVFLSILAMDSYNRGYLPGIASVGGLGSRIGNALFFSQSDTRAGDPGVNAGFYATAYNWNGLNVISYRGTDNYRVFDRTSDLWNGWTIGAGFNNASQARLAINFYERVTGMPLYNSFGSNTILTAFRISVTVYLTPKHSPRVIPSRLPSSLRLRVNPSPRRPLRSLREPSDFTQRTQGTGSCRNRCPTTAVYANTLTGSLNASYPLPKHPHRTSRLTSHPMPEPYEVSESKPVFSAVLR
jgi:hypothetical protein